VKAKAVVGIAPGLRFAHGLGLLHRAVKASNILFETNQQTQIADFSPIPLETGDAEPFSGDRWSQAPDVSAFALSLSDIVVDCPATLPIGGAGGQPLSATVPAFVSRMIEDGGPRKSKFGLSFAEIVARRKENRFEIIAGVDSYVVSAFVSWVESLEQGGETQ
jgi:serine/threonine protein kinase